MKANLCVNYCYRNQFNFLKFFLCLQFPDVLEFCEAMANAGKIVVVAALDGTYQGSGKFITVFWLLKDLLLLFSLRFWRFLEFGAVG